MKAYIIENFGSIDGIEKIERAMPTAEDNSVVIKVKAASIARRDLYILNQRYPLPPKPAVIPLSEGVGEIISIGKNVSRFKMGDKVTGNYFPNWRDGDFNPEIADQLGCTLDGMLAEYAALNEKAIVKIPVNLSWEEAATLPCAALTAWNALSGPNPLLPGSNIVTIGSGGVAVFAIQFAKRLGCQVISLTSKNSKFDALHALGADEVINYRTNADWSEQVKEFTCGIGATRIIETGGIDTFEQSVKAIAFNGEITLVSSAGILNNSQGNLQSILNSIFVKLVKVRPVFVGHRRSFENMNRAIEAYKIKPAIERIFSFEEAKKSYEYLKTGENIGKVVISFPD